jgi:hypothetical protein
MKKLDRSLEHLDALNKHAERFFGEDFYGVYRLHAETNSRSTKHLFRVELLKPLPLLEWGIIVGDAVHCWRSALDQLAYALSLSSDGNTAFPMARTEKYWVTQAPAAMWGIPEPLIAAVDKTQPYHRGDAAHTHPLAVLNSLSNTDKHRFIPVTALVPDSAEWNITGMQGMASYGSINLKTGRVLKDGAVIADMKFVPDDSGLEPQVQMNGHIEFRIAFGEAGVPSAVAGRPVVDAMGDIGEALLEVFRDIDEAVKAHLASHMQSPPSPSKG